MDKWSAPGQLSPFAVLLLLLLLLLLLPLAMPGEAHMPSAAPVGIWS